MTTSLPNHSANISIVLVDDHEIVCEGLSSILSLQDNLVIVGQAATQKQAVELCLDLKPDVILMDVRLPDGSGIEACREILAVLPETKVLMLTSYHDDEAVLAAIMAGAMGYLLKEISAKSIIEGIFTIVSGESLLDPKVTGQIFQKLRHHPQDNELKLNTLTKKEQSILNLIAEGKTNKEIAKLLFLSDKTIKNYVSVILSKLQLTRRSAAAAFITELNGHT